MGRKRLRKAKRSKGERKSVAYTPDVWSPFDRAIFKAQALAAGKRVCTTIPNPDRQNTKARFIRVCING